MQNKMNPSDEGTISGASERRGKTIDEMKAKYTALTPEQAAILKAENAPPLAAFKNESPNKFDDISSEFWRAYDYGKDKHGNNKVVTIEWPQLLSVSKSGGHRIFDRMGVSHYIPAGWIHISWMASPNFVK